MKPIADGFGLIEGPVWHPSFGLLFSDVINGGVFRLDEKGRTHLVFGHRRGIGGMSIHEAGGLVVSGRNISFKRFGEESSVTLLDRDPDNDNVGYNDITTDSEGRVYAGSLGSSPVFDDGRSPKAGDLYLIDLDGSTRVVAEDVMLTNGLGFSPDGKTLYHSDSRRQRVFRYDVSNNGDLGQKEVFVETESGSPDGLCVATDGSVWVAIAGGSGVAVYDELGNETRFIEIPLPMCTSVCFGSSELNELYIVTGSDGVDGDDRGAIFVVDSEAVGLPVPEARVRLPPNGDSV